MTKKEIERRILNLVESSIIKLSPADVRKQLSDIPGDEIRSALARLMDSGPVGLDSDMRLYIRVLCI